MKEACSLAEYRLIRSTETGELCRLNPHNDLPEGYEYVTKLYMCGRINHLEPCCNIENVYGDFGALKEKYWSLERYQDKKEKRETTMDYTMKLKLRRVAVQAEIRELKNLMECCLNDMELKINRELRISGEVLISDSEIKMFVGDLKLDCIKWRDLATEKIKRDREIYDLNLLLESKAVEPNLFRDTEV